MEQLKKAREAAEEIKKVYLCYESLGSVEWVDKPEIDDKLVKCLYDTDGFDPNGCTYTKEGIPKEKCKSYREYKIGRRDYNNQRRKDDPTFEDELE